MEGLYKNSGLAIAGDEVVDLYTSAEGQCSLYNRTHAEYCVLSVKVDLYKQTGRQRDLYNKARAKTSAFLDSLFSRGSHFSLAMHCEEVTHLSHAVCQNCTA